MNPLNINNNSFGGFSSFGGGGFPSFEEWLRMRSAPQPTERPKLPSISSIGDTNEVLSNLQSRSKQPKQETMIFPSDPRKPKEKMLFPSSDRDIILEGMFPLEDNPENILTKQPSSGPKKDKSINIVQSISPFGEIFRRTPER
jgi:hypothetical protein